MTSPSTGRGAQAVAEPGRAQATIIAFTSHTGGIGRTAVVSNLAAVLSLAGQRVLVMDAGVDDPRVHEYLRPFHNETLPADQILDGKLTRMLAHAPAAEPGRQVPREPDVPPLTVQRYRFPVDLGTIDVIATDPLTTIGERFPSWMGREDGLELREQLRDADYDYVLIDGPTDMSPAVMAWLALLCDIVAVCFTPQTRSTVRAAELAHHIGAAVRPGPSIIAMPLQFDDQDHDRAQQTWTLIQDVFAKQRSEAEMPKFPADVVKIPYQPRDALFDKALAVLIDEPGPQGGLVSAFHQLANRIAEGILDQLPAIPDRLRLQYRFALDLESEDARPSVHLLYAPEDRTWADWVGIQLERGGARVARLSEHDAWRGGPGLQSVVVVSSPHLARSPAGRRARELAGQTARVAKTAPFDLVVVAVSEEPAMAALAEAPGIRIAGCTEPQARTRLLGHFVLVDRAVDDQLPVVYFPGGPGATGSVSNVPPKNPDFVGRGQELEAMRDNFVAAGGLRSWTLTGTAGIGKSEIAKEYAHRFAFDYDLVWWIPSDNRNSVLASLTELGVKMGVPSIEGRGPEVLEELAAGSFGSRWLLIYDNADGDDTLTGLVPTVGTGHVIITSRRPASAFAGEAGLVNPLQRNDCVAILRNVVTHLSIKDARSVAVLLGDQPLSIALAAAWLREATALLGNQAEFAQTAAAWAAAEFRTQIERLAGSVTPTAQLPQPTPASMIAVLALAMETLQANESGQLALRLAQHCAFLAAGGVSLRLLRSQRMLAALTTAAADRAALTEDPLELDLVLWTGTRYGLFEIGWEPPASLRMHRLVQVLVRHLMTAEQRQACHAEVLHGLAAFAPTDAEGGFEQDLLDFAELQKHLVPSDAAANSTFTVRRWLVDQISYVYRQGGPDEWQFAAGLGERMLSEWTPVTDGERALRMRLEFRLLNLHRALDRPAEGILARAQRLLAEHRNVFGPHHPGTLKSARSTAADLRRLGRFADARAEDRATLLGFRSVLGENHPDTLRATSNLAHSLLLAGDTPAALVLAEENTERYLSQYGPDHPNVWWSACNIGYYLCELGRYEEASKILDGALPHIARLRRSGHPDELRIQRFRAIVRRRSGERLSPAERIASASNAAVLTAETLRNYRALFGSDHARTRACQLSYALDQHQMGNSRDAVEQAEDCLQGYIRPIPDHPFAAVCRTNLAIFLRAERELDRALELGRQSRAELCNWLGEEHPWALAARINYARILADSDQVEDATELLRSAYEDSKGFLNPGHPYILLAGGNLASGADQWGDVGVDVP